MRLRNVLRIPKITAVAMLVLIAAGCDSNDSTNEMSTDVNLADDAAADDVLGANDMAANEMAANDINVT